MEECQSPHSLPTQLAVAADAAHKTYVCRRSRHYERHRIYVQQFYLKGVYEKLISEATRTVVDVLMRAH